MAFLVAALSGSCTATQSTVPCPQYTSLTIEHIGELSGVRAARAGLGTPGISQLETKLPHARLAHVLFVLKVPASNERGPRYAEQALAAIHQANPNRQPLTLLIADHDQQAGVYIRHPPDLKAVIEGQLAAQYPHAKQERLPDAVFETPDGYRTWTAELHLSPDIFPLRRYTQFEDLIERSTSDPLAGLLTAIAPTKQDSLHCRIELHVRPASRWRH